MMAKGKTDNNRKRVGRPMKFKKEQLPQIEKYLRKGATLDELADFLQVHRSQVYRWRDQHPEFRDVIAAVREEMADKIERALYTKALGSRIRATKFFYDKEARQQAIAVGMDRIRNEYDPDDVLGIALARDELMEQINRDGVGIVRTRYIEHYTPDTAAIKFALTNMRPDKWKDKHEVDNNLSGNVSHNIDWMATEGCDPLAPIEDIEAEGAKLDQDDDDTAE